MTTASSLTHIRTPTYRRPAALRRCLESLQAQTNPNWICDVYDDCPDASGGLIVAALDDSRIIYHHNRPQLFASRNIDQCFTRDNPHDADYFFVLEDDNFVLPDFVMANIAACEDHGVALVFRNQLIEFKSGTDRANLSERGILDDKLTGGVHPPDVFRLCLMADIGVSNGGLFWSRHAVTDLEIRHPCSATLQEYMRTFAISEPILVAMEPLAVWAENGEATTRDIGADAGYYKRELSLKCSIGTLQRKAWAMAKPEDRKQYLSHPVFRYPQHMRATGLVKSHTSMRVRDVLPLKDIIRLALRGALIRIFGKAEPSLAQFLAARSD